MAAVAAVAGSEPAVPPAEFPSYYGRPILKAPVWKHDIPAYLFTGGLAAGASLLAAGGDLTGRPALRRAGRLTALGAVGASTYFLIADLGRPERFHHMLRVAKPTSPMSVGTWILAVFGPAAGIAAVAEAAPLLPRRGPLGVLRRLLPGAGRAAGLVVGVDRARAGDLHRRTARRHGGAVVARGVPVPAVRLRRQRAGQRRRQRAASRSTHGRRVRPAGWRWPGRHWNWPARTASRRRLGLLSEPYRTGRAGRLLNTGRMLTAAGVAGALLGRRSRAVSALSGAALLAASVATRFGLFEGGVASARDPRYTVVPQRLRRDARAAAGAKRRDGP